MENNKSEDQKEVKLINWTDAQFSDIAEFKKYIGNFIKEQRKKLKISPLKMAKDLRITYQTYNQYENGQIHIPLHTLFIIAKLLNLSFDSIIDNYYKEILGGDEIDLIEMNNSITVASFSHIPLNADLDKSINIVKKIYKSGNKILILALKGTLDIYQSLIFKKP